MGPRLTITCVGLSKSHWPAEGFHDIHQTRCGGGARNGGDLAGLLADSTNL